MTVNWDVVGAVSEFVGAAGVIASLMYVAMQMKAGNVASRIDAKLRTVEMFVDFQDMLIADPKLNELMISGRRDSEKLSKEDYLQFSNLAMKTSWFFSAGFFMRQSGALSNDDWHEFETILRYWALSPGYQQWWRKSGSANFSGDFRDFVEAQMSGAESRAQHSTGVNQAV